MGGSSMCFPAQAESAKGVASPWLMAIARTIVMICPVRRQRLFGGLGWRIENRSNNNYNFNNRDASIPLASGGKKSGANSNNIFGRHARIAGANDDNNVDSPPRGYLCTTHICRSSSKRRQDFLNNCTPVACRASAVCAIVPSRLDRSQDAFGTSLMASSSLRVEHGKPIIEQKKRFPRITMTCDI